MWAGYLCVSRLVRDLQTSSSCSNLKTNKYKFTENRAFIRSIFCFLLTISLMFFQEVWWAFLSKIYQELESPSGALPAIWSLFLGSRFRAGRDFPKEVHFDDKHLTWSWGLSQELWLETQQKGPGRCLRTPQESLLNSLGDTGTGSPEWTQGFCASNSLFLTAANFRGRRKTFS